MTIGLPRAAAAEKSCVDVQPFIDRVLKPYAKAWLTRHPVLKQYAKTLLKRYTQLAGDPFRSYEVCYQHEQGLFDTLYVERNGLIRLEGWATSESLNEVNLPRCVVNQTEAPLLAAFRVPRTDVASHLGSHGSLMNRFRGLVCLYRASDLLGTAQTKIQLVYRDQLILEIMGSFPCVTVPDYAYLLETSQVLHREHIYGFGPPSTVIQEEVASLSQTLQGPLLDFGCGSGALVKFLREHGVDAYGIELNSQSIIEAVRPEVSEYITLYDGNFPLPFPDCRFRSAIAAEVIEHIPNYEEALQEIARVVSQSCMITVPDMSSIPICHPHKVVPWHLLEGTHVNFFTQQSLERTLGKYFAEVEIAKIGAVMTNDTTWYTSIAAICRKSLSNPVEKG